MARIIECGRSDSVKIHNPNDNGNPLSVQIPANLVYAADAVFREMCYRGETSPSLTVVRTVSGSGHTLWLAEYGGKKGTSITPWGAIQHLSRQIEHEE